MLSPTPSPASPRKADVSALALPHPVAGMVAVEISEGHEAATSAYQQLEAEGIACAYQAEAFVRAAAARQGAGRVVTLVGRDANGQPAMVLPLEIIRRFGAAIAACPGEGHANFSLGLWTRDTAAALDGTSLTALLRAAAPLAQIDLFAFASVPPHWHNAPSPLASLPHQPSPSASFGITLGPDPEEVFARALSAHARKRLRKKKAAMMKRGTLTFGRASSVDEAQAVIAQFLGWKAQRFAELGISNPFAEPGTDEFLTALACDGLQDGRPSLHLFTLRLDGALIALLGVGISGGRMSGMINAIGYGDYRKDSPGDLIIAHAVEEACRMGCLGFDLGVGEARYKETLCEEEMLLTDAFFPVTARGTRAAFVVKTRGRIKRFIKQNDRLWALVSLLRRMKARLT